MPPGEENDQQMLMENVQQTCRENVKQTLQVETLKKRSQRVC